MNKRIVNWLTSCVGLLVTPVLAALILALTPVRAADPAPYIIAAVRSVPPDQTTDKLQQFPTLHALAPQLTSRLASVLHKPGGVKGQRLQVIDFNDRCDPERARAIARQIIKRKIRLVIGHNCSRSAMAAAPLYAAADIIMMSPGATAPAFTDEGGYSIFRMAPRRDRLADWAARYLAEVYRRRRMALVFQDDRQKAGPRNRMTTRLRARLGALAVHVHHVAKLTVPPAAASPGRQSSGWQQILRRLKQQKTGILIAVMNAAGVNALLDDLKAIDWAPQLVILGPAPDRLKTTGPLAREDMIGSLLILRRDYAAVPDADSLRTAFARLQQPPTPLNVLAATGLQAWGQAALAAGTLDNRLITRKLHELRFSSIIGEFSFDIKGDTDLPGYAAYIVPDVNRLKLVPAPSELTCPKPAGSLPPLSLEQLKSQ